MNKARFYGGIEAGGSKFVCAVGSKPGNIRDIKSIPTTSPQETLAKVIEFFVPYMPLKAIGAASFGPLDLDKNSPSFGSITTTPKAGWANTNLKRILEDELKIPVFIDTDVNGAAIGESRWGAAKGLSTFIYLTVGTGIGGGAIINGRPAHGLSHPEMGHIMVPHDKQLDPFPGVCPYHGDCLEGLASATAVAKRWGVPPDALPQTHEAWILETDYMAHGVANFILTLSPQKVIMGGGIMKAAGLLEGVRDKVNLLLNGYVNLPLILEHIDNYIVAPGLGDMAGVLGAIALAETRP